MSETAATRHPDIEIYVKSRNLEEICQWLNGVFSAVERQHSQGTVHQYRTGCGIPVLIHEKVSGKAWTSVWFDSDSTPWEKDLDCAIIASQQMDTEIRCIAGGWNDGDDPDEWWKVATDGEATKIQWRT
ncbi:hypothetical protein [Aliamphritea hakodatensis]|uniref:hypothetical protein n=1 Tax=Aliamphritea hakodatensis TaxID=2895352 RepID=UPI0022FD3E59|nr:hypothetical protein [Aliamphritea hakodatensis]